MTLDEAIEHAIDVAKKKICKECANEHAQLAAWLTELKERRKNGKHELQKILHR